MAAQAQPTEREEREFLAGQTSVLWAMCTAIAQTHPNVKALTLAFYANAELQVSTDLMGNMSEAFERGQENGRNRMAMILKALGG